MSNYKEMFKLSIKDVDLIEQALRQQINHLSHIEMMAQHNEPDSVINHNKIIELTHVLGILHNQKIWYGQTHRTGVPLG